MKRFFIITLGLAAITTVVSCNKTRRSPGRTYMPDMTYSRAYETYTGLDSNKFTNDTNAAGKKIFYNHLPVNGTIARGEMLWTYPYKNDAEGYTSSAR